MCHDVILAVGRVLAIMKSKADNIIKPLIVFG
jgi:hypothetical protein